MRVLIVKTSSMGDVLHTLPALSDAALAFPGIRFDWVVEEGFAQIPSWHETAISQSSTSVITVPRTLQKATVSVSSRLSLRAGLFRRKNSCVRYKTTSIN